MGAMNLNAVRRKYEFQRVNAMVRGIGWKLTFEEWLAWWGEDLCRRGRGRDNLQMMRIGDTGPYALNNIRKGYPRDNARTRCAVQATKRTARLAKELESARDADQGTLEGPDACMDPEEESISDYYRRIAAPATLETWKRHD